MDYIQIWAMAMGAGLLLGWALFGKGKTRKRKCWSCGEKVRSKEAFYDGIAHHDLHRRCHKTREDVYSATWDFLSHKYVENGYPPASLLFRPEFEYIEHWDERMKKMKEYECPDWSVGADHRNQTGVPVEYELVYGHLTI